MEHPSYIIKDGITGKCMVSARDINIGEIIYTNEMEAVRLVTEQYVIKYWDVANIKLFYEYAWPVGNDTYAIWDENPKKWKPINHSCDPNCWMDGLSVTARKYIKKHEELTLDYATFVTTFPKFKCWCGTAICRGFLKDNEYKEQWFQERYKNHCSPFINGLIINQC